MAGDPDRLARRYEEDLREHFRLRGTAGPVFDLIFLGVGTDGHTASLFPDSPVLAETRRWTAAVKGGRPELWRVTLTYPVLNCARQVVFLVTGADKAAVLRRLSTEPQAGLPAQRVRPHAGTVRWIVDREAAGGAGTDQEVGMTRIFAADIGGTHSRFAAFELDAGGRPVMAERRWLKTRVADSFDRLLATLRAEGPGPVPAGCDIAVIAVAGPVEDEAFSTPPNIDWEVDLTRAKIGLDRKRCVLVNDFVAQAYACGSPLADSARPVLVGEALPGAVRAVIGAGTGLGHAALVPVGAGRFQAVASEGGHTSFPFRGPQEWEYARFLEQEIDEPYVRSEIVVSGRGLSLVHRFLSGADLRPAEIAAKLTPTAETLSWMARFYARAARNYALQVLARGGLYIAGGVAAKLPELVTHPAFRRRIPPLGHHGPAVGADPRLPGHRGGKRPVGGGPARRPALGRRPAPITPAGKTLKRIYQLKKRRVSAK